MSTRILVVIGHPLAGSLSHELGQRYAEAARAAGAEVRVRDLSERQPANPPDRASLRSVREGDRSWLDADVAADLADLEWAQHVLIVFPQWWGLYPAVLKAWIDRSFVSGVTYRSTAGYRWEPLLTGRTARLIMTCDVPRFYNQLVYRDAAISALRRATLGYCGIKTIGVSRFTPVKTSTPQAREKWLAAAGRFGTADARR